VNGSIVTGRYEQQRDVFRARGIERTVLYFMVQVVLDGEIVAFFGRNDPTDPTARLAAILAGTTPPGPPIPRPDPVCR